MLLNKMFKFACRQVVPVNRILAQTFSNEVPQKMEKTVNQITLLGRVGGEPQKRGNEEHPVVIFSLATHLNYRYEGGDYMQKTDWHRICIFKPSLRESVYNYLKKGQRVMVTGRLSYGEVKDEQGNIKTASSIIADDIIFFQQ